MVMRAASRADWSEGCDPIDLLSAMFAARDWPCELRSGKEVACEVAGSWSNYSLRAVRSGEENTLQLLCMPGISVPLGKRSGAASLVTRINEQLWLGHFDLWAKGGVVAFRHAILLGDDGMVSVAQGHALVDNAIAECDRFYPAFQFLLWGGREPDEALAAALVDPAGEA
jgi:hypothetical protein